MFDRSQLRKGTLEGCILQIIALRLERKGLIAAAFRASPAGPSRKYYSLTPEGATYLAEFREAWRATAAGVAAILEGNIGPERRQDDATE